jgi:hypothetical protein
MNITYVGSPSQGPLGSKRLFLGLFSSLFPTAKLQTKDNHVLANMSLIIYKGSKYPRPFLYNSWNFKYDCYGFLLHREINRSISRHFTFPLKHT